MVPLTHLSAAKQLTPAMLDLCSAQTATCRTPHTFTLEHENSHMSSTWPSHSMHSSARSNLTHVHTWSMSTKNMSGTWPAHTTKMKPEMSTTVDAVLVANERSFLRCSDKRRGTGRKRQRKGGRTVSTRGNGKGESVDAVRVAKERSKGGQRVRKVTEKREVLMLSSSAASCAVGTARVGARAVCERRKRYQRSGGVMTLSRWQTNAASCAVQRREEAQAENGTGRGARQ